MLGPRYGVFHAALLAEMDQLLQRLGLALLAASGF